MKRCELLAGKCSGNYIFKCSAGKIHFNYGIVEILFCQEGFLQFSQIVDQAVCRIAQNSKSNHIFLRCGYVTLKVPREESGDLLTLVNEAVYKIKGFSYMPHNQKN